MNQIVPLSFDDELDMGSAADLINFARRENQLKCEASLHEFVKQAWLIVEPKNAFLDNWHIAALCHELELIDQSTGRYKVPSRRAIFNVPPGMMKSLIVMVFFPAWVWAKNPRRRFLCASYGSVLSNRDNVRCRQLIESEWYQEHWNNVQLADDQNTKTRYNTTHNGWRISTSVGGPGTGEHPDYILIDDPHSAMQARSDTERQAALDWFDNTVSTRTGRMPAFVLIMQRLHVSDLTGHLLKKGGWHHVRWPMRYEKCSCATAPNCDPDGERRCALHQTDPTWRADPLDPRTVAGELLHPTFKTEEDVKRLELDLGPLDAPGQLQQRPVAEGGGLFKRAWFKIIDQLPGHAIKQSCRGWDTAATQGGGDYTVGVKTTRFFGWEVKDGRREFKSYPEFYIEDVMRDQLSPANVDTVMLAIARQDGKAVVIREEREGGGSGKAVTNSHANMLAGFAYDEMLLGSDKVTRSKPLRTQVEAGNVYLLRGPWNEAFISELCAFNAGDHDDQVDGASCSFNGLLEMPTPKPRSVTLMP